MFKIMSLLCLMSVQAYADPGAGSFAKYSYKSQSKSGTTSIGTQTDSIVTSDGQSFQLKTDMSVVGQVNEAALWNLSGNYFSNTEYFINHCDQTGGNSESVTVASGTYDTCHILFKQPDPQTVSQEIWLSTLVPLFTVKQIRVTNDGSQITLELEQFESKTL